MLHRECSSMPMHSSGQQNFRSMIELPLNDEDLKQFIDCFEKYSMYNKQFITLVVQYDMR